MIDALKYFAAVASGFVFLASPCEGAEEKSKEETTNMAFGTDFYLTNDSDNFQSRRVSVEFFPAFENADRFLGFRLGDYQYRQNNWQRAGKKISFLARSIETRTGDGGGNGGRPVRAGRAHAADARRQLPHVADKEHGSGVSCDA